MLGVIVYILWHETYRIDQIGTIRTQLALTPTIDRAIESGNKRTSAGGRRQTKVGKLRGLSA